MYEEDSVVYLVMQYIAGEGLDDLWARLQPNERSSIVIKMRNILDEMISLPPPSPSFYGSADRGPFPYFLFWTPEANKTINGPFTIEEELCLDLVGKVRESHTYSKQHLARAEWFRKHITVALTGHPAVFSHCGIQMKNIIVEQARSQRGDKTSHEPVLIDWEDARSYPN